MKPPPVHLWYETGGRSEYCLSFGEANAGRTILIVPPLFDEMNRTRRMLVEAMGTLAANGVQTLLPDLPGCNESLADLAEQSLDTWQRAVADCAARLDATHIASLRGGTLVDNLSLPRWRLAPVRGASLLKTMLRTRIAADKEVGISTTTEQLLAAPPVELSGNVIGAGMLKSLEAAEPDIADNVHTVALADIGGSPLWLRAEPGEDAAMSLATAASLDRWSASCGG